MATTKTPKPTLPTDTAATTPTEDDATLAAATPAPETPPTPAPEQETTAAPEQGGKSPGGDPLEKIALAVTPIKPPYHITDHRVQLVEHIHPDGTCDALATMPPRVVIASRIAASMMQQPRYVSAVVGKPDERKEAIARLVASALAIADDLLRQAAETAATPEA